MNTVNFEYDNNPTEKSLSVQVGAADEDSGLGWILWVIISVISLAVLGGVFMFFFVEFEDEEEEEDDEEKPQDATDTYAWGQANQPQVQQQQVAAPAAAAPAQPVAAAPQPSYPGWKWDAESNQWVPDQ